MVQIAMLIFAFPLGLLRWRRGAAYLVTAAVFVAVLIPQTIDTRNNHSSSYNASYWVVQAITFAVAVGLVTWASTLSSRRRARRVEA